jgi:hypothetical protein
MHTDFPRAWRSRPSSACSKDKRERAHRGVRRKKMCSAGEGASEPRYQSAHAPHRCASAGVLEPEVAGAVVVVRTAPSGTLSFAVRVKDTSHGLLVLMLPGSICHNLGNAAERTLWPARRRAHDDR